MLEKLETNLKSNYYFKGTAVLAYNSHTIQFTIFKCTI